LYYNLHFSAYILSGVPMTGIFDICNNDCALHKEPNEWVYCCIQGWFVWQHL